MGQQIERFFYVDLLGRLCNPLWIIVACKTMGSVNVCGQLYSGIFRDLPLFKRVMYMKVYSV